MLQLEAQGFARAAGPLPGDASLPQAAVLSLNEVVESPPPGCTAPVSFAFSPDGTLLTCLFSADGTLTRQLYAFDLATRACAPLVAPASGGVDEARVSHEEAMRRERARERGLGVTRYAWATAAQRVLVPDPGANALLVQDGAGAPLRAVAVTASASSAAPLLDAALSPDGAHVAFVQRGELFVASAAPGREREPPVQLTAGATGDKTNGLAEFIAAEELHRSAGFWWSHDGGSIAFCEADTSPVERFRIPHYGDAPGAEEIHAYPFAGGRNAVVRLGVVQLHAPGAVVWCDLACACPGSAPDEEYLCQVAWAHGDAQIHVQLLDRAQKTLSFVTFDARTGARLRTAHTEHSQGYCNASDAWKPLKDGRLLLSSEHTGWRHLYVCAPDGTRRAVTSGQWAVDELQGVDETSGLVYFTGSAETPLQKHLYVVELDGGAAAPPRRLTPEPGMHGVALDAGLKRFVDVYDAPNAPPSVTLRSLADGAAICVVFAAQAPPHRALRLGLAPPLERTFVAADGSTQLHGALYLPTGGTRPYPLVVSVYGGPHVQTVLHSWAMTVDMRAQLLRSRGFAVLKLDSRGSARRGAAFEQALHLRMGGPELADQAAAVSQLVSDGFIHPSRVGIYGWSYGGYLSALAALRMPHVFRCAVAGAPVTSWDGYDTGYTERYMGLPDTQAAAYKAASALESSLWAVQTSPVLLIHGTLDENVHFRHTARLVAALTAKRAPHELLLFPGERHLPRGAEGRAYAEQRVLDFLNKHLL